MKNMDKIEMSLDDIIKINKKSKGAPKGQNRRGGARTGGGFKRSPRKLTAASGGGILKGRGRGGINKRRFQRGDVNSAWKHDMFEGGRKTIGGGGAAAAAAGGFGNTTKLLVSNLDFGVSDADIRELFHEFGPLKAASVHYDRSGRSLGSADIVFERRTDALKAMKTYNGVPLDGRAMNIQLATSDLPPAKPQRPATFATKKPIRGSPRKGGFGRRPVKNRGGNKPEVTIDQLNAELDAYTMQG